MTAMLIIAAWTAASILLAGAWIAACETVRLIQRVTR